MSLNIRYQLMQAVTYLVISYNLFKFINNNNHICSNNALMQPLII